MRVIQLTKHNYFNDERLRSFSLYNQETYPPEYKNAIIKMCFPDGNIIFWFNGREVSKAQVEELMFNNEFLEKL